ncbi:Sarcosine/dimethylglycine N-methyltransferase [Gracilariopsis chorda]|uniref:Sarcosine/dimethylglycine N-methyltransferase n=1 Tax=Gracilariopsis chorda TaxID=448386 RepID=A0A2V3IWW9_9FLOR|nr:Sarcosine/dimethylglycine N-methyltransferase [Gracilariopsis chorda]|eukprot:PXF46599.1 Sarcosine/dimethylglycine N-methyltransferase [Gracilariopsis chorda]
MVTEHEINNMNNVYDHINTFYQNIVATGRDDLHAGFFRTPEDDGNTISRQAIEELVALAKSVGARFDPAASVVDLGAGMGGCAHKLAADHGCTVTCVNILPSQNSVNRARSHELGLDHLVSVVEGSYDNLPPEWNDKFDTVWSMDAFLHGPDKRAIIGEAFRVAKPGAVFIFSDIMAGSYAMQKDVDIYRRRYNIKHEMLTMAQYEDVLEETGFIVLRARDFTAHLVPFLRGASKDGERLWDTFSDEIRPFFEEYVQSYKQSVESLVEAEGQAWSALVCVKPKQGEENKYRRLSGSAK